jgi:hypothetical protein
MNDPNGITARVKRVLDSHDVEDQGLINSLVLECLLSQSEQLKHIKNQNNIHGQVHSKESEEQLVYRAEARKVLDGLKDRLKSVEKIIYFPSQHKKAFIAMVFGLLFLLNLWFISGFREMFLRMLNAPDWLITFLVPGAVP